MSSPAERAKGVFLAAVDLLDPAEQSAFLDRECGGDTELRRRVDGLLAADRTDDRLVLSRAAWATDTPAPMTADAGAVLAGRYRLVEPLGRGGMGAVWRAEQFDPVQREVAVKLIRPGLDTAGVLARFAAERQALARMDHPNVAHVFDAGTTPDGRPFFVMELVNGDPLTAYCDARRLTPRQRLELFVTVCQAVQHAHQKGVIHRDLKPANVLVAEVDGRPVPKVIDFGIAKATDRPLVDDTLDTGVGTVVGTPEYMAPEQAAFDAADIDTRADVYALGVVLYELLTGTTPLDRATLRDANLLEVLRVVREVDPPRPSDRLGTCDTLPERATARGVEPKTLTGLLRTELDWVVMKALEKDRERRYATAAGFAADVQRYLNGEPVLAVPPSRAYRVRKFVRRNRLQVSAAGLVAAALVAGMVGTSVGLMEARKQEAEARKQEAVARTEAEEKERARAGEAKRAESEREAKEDAVRKKAQAENASRILAQILIGLNPEQAASGNRPLAVQLGDRIDTAAKLLVGDATGDPAEVAKLQRYLGVAAVSLGQNATGLRVLEQAAKTLETGLGPDHPEAVAAQCLLVRTYVDNLRPADAIAVGERLLARQADGFQCNLAHAYTTVGRAADAIKLCEAVLAGSPSRQNALDMQYELAFAYLAARRLPDAIRAYEGLLATDPEVLGPDHPIRTFAEKDLGVAYRRSGRRDEALKLLTRSLDTLRRQYGPDNLKATTVEHELAAVHLESNRPGTALPLIEHVAAVSAANNGPGSYQTIAHQYLLVLAHEELELTAELAALCERVLPHSRQVKGLTPDIHLKYLSYAVAAHNKLGRHDRALELAAEEVEARRRFDPPNDLMLAEALLALGRTQADLRNYDRAAAAIRECQKLFEKTAPNGYKANLARATAGRLLLEQGKLEDAEPHLRAGFAGMARRLHERSRIELDEPAATAGRLADLCEKTDRAVEAAKWRRTATPIRREKLPPPRASR